MEYKNDYENDQQGYDGSLGYSSVICAHVN